MTDLDMKAIAALCAREDLKAVERDLAAAGHPRLADMAHEIRKALENDKPG